MVRSLLRLFEVLMKPHVEGELKAIKENKNMKNWIVVSEESRVIRYDISAVRTRVQRFVRTFF